MDKAVTKARELASMSSSEKSQEEKIEEEKPKEQAKDEL